PPVLGLGVRVGLAGVERDTHRLPGGEDADRLAPVPDDAEAAARGAGTQDDKWTHAFTRRPGRTAFPELHRLVGDDPDTSTAVRRPIGRAERVDRVRLERRVH